MVTETYFDMVSETYFDMVSETYFETCGARWASGSNGFFSLSNLQEKGEDAHFCCKGKRTARSLPVPRLPDLMLSLSCLVQV